LSLYEGMFMMDNRRANRDWEGAIEALAALIAKHGGEILRTVKWGERRLAYEVAGRRRATYVLVYFNCGGDGVNRIYRECELSDLVYRALILKISALPPEDAPTGKDIPDKLRDRSRCRGQTRRAPTEREKREEKEDADRTTDDETPSDETDKTEAQVKPSDEGDKKAAEEKPSGEADSRETEEKPSDEPDKKEAEEKASDDDARKEESV